MLLSSESKKNLNYVAVIPKLVFVKVSGMSHCRLLAWVVVCLEVRTGVLKVQMIELVLEVLVIFRPDTGPDLDCGGNMLQHIFTFLVLLE